MSRPYNINRISYFMCYTVEDICNLFSSRHLHAQTVRKWIKNGLPVIDGSKPALIYGDDLKDFLGKVNDNNHLSLNFDEFYCFSCKEAHIPLGRKVYVEQNGSFIKVKGLCPKKHTIMNRSYKLADYPELKKIFELEDMARLYDSINPALDTQIQDNQQNATNESFFKGEENNYDRI